MFASLVIERDPLRLQDAPGAFLYWVQVAGGVAAFGLVLWLVFGLSQLRAVDRARIPRWQSRLFLTGGVVAGLFYAPLAVVRLLQLILWLVGSSTQLSPWDRFENICLTGGGLGALLAVGLPFVVHLSKMRPRRVWALAKLSFKEAIRRRVLYAFSFLLLVFLFASWFIPSKPENQLRTYVWVVYFAMTVLLLVTAVLLAAFSIPADVRHQTIHTIVTKPVERFEIVLGRFLGFLALMTVVLAVITLASLLYVVRGVHPEAAAESLKARVPIFGDLSFENTSKGKESDKAENVGREWEYRSYISGPTGARQPPQFAVWKFTDLPAGLADRPAVRCEFSFDIYRTTKGQENKGVSCAFYLQTWRFHPGDDGHFRTERAKMMQKAGGRSEAEIDNELAEKYGYYEVPGKDVTDFHTLSIDVPGGLFRNAQEADEPRRRELQIGSRQPPPPLQVRVKCNSVTQYVGMAKYDLYLRQDDPEGGSERRLFALNFCKAAFGVWLQLGLMIGVAVALSTYLSGVISLLVTGLLYLGGLCREFISSVGTGSNPYGGPFESFVRLTRRDVGVVPMEDTPVKAVATFSDNVFRWFIRRVLDVIPDIDRFDLTSYVAEGFSIGGTQMLLNFLLLAAYLLPWAVLGYYLIKWREVASPN
jgi:ABC-type transport system involved in multi-copper enzyme maturation permease subunit